nr:UBN2 domain-containing protein [Tanacetum cinerariifolium]
AGDASGSTLPPKKLREDYHAETSSTGGKPLAAIHRLLPAGSSVLGAVTKPFVAASVTPMSDCEDDVPADSVTGPDLRTCHPAEWYIISSDVSHHSNSNVEVNSLARSLVAAAPVPKVRGEPVNPWGFRDSASINGVHSDFAGTSHPNKSKLSAGSFYASQDLDPQIEYRVAPPALFSLLCAMDYDKLYTKFNVGSAQQMRHGAEVRMRAEHTLEQKINLRIDESIDSAFARFNTIITSLKTLDECYSSKNYVRKFLIALHPRWRAKVTAIKESKDVTSLSLDELIGNLKVHEMIIKNDSEIVKAKGERKSLALKAKRILVMKNVRLPVVKTKNKNQRAFVGGSWSYSGEKDDEKAKDETCLVAQAYSEDLNVIL